MLDQVLNDGAAVQRMRASTLGSQLDSFAARLSQLGYARSSIRDRLWTLAALGKWLKRRGLAATDLRRDIIAAFLTSLVLSVVSALLAMVRLMAPRV